MTYVCPSCGKRAYRDHRGLKCGNKECDNFNEFILGYHRQVDQGRYTNAENTLEHNHNITKASESSDKKTTDESEESRRHREENLECPTCGEESSVYSRKKNPVYRCDNCGREFDNQGNKENDSIQVDREKYWTIVSARIAGVLDTKTRDWYILTSYENVSAERITEIETVEDAKSMEHPYEMTPAISEELERLKNTGGDIQREKEMRLENLKEELYEL